jgi:phospholipid transport system transporter-binding protein
MSPGRARDPCADSISVETSGPEQILVKGALTFRTALRASIAGEQCLDALSAPSIQVDCRSITGADSAGLAVLIEWIAHARRAGRVLHFVNLPPAILAVAAISEVESILV